MVLLVGEGASGGSTMRARGRLCLVKGGANSVCYVSGRGPSPRPLRGHPWLDGDKKAYVSGREPCPCPLRGYPQLDGDKEAPL